MIFKRKVTIEIKLINGDSREATVYSRDNFRQIVDEIMKSGFIIDERDAIPVTAILTFKDISHVN